MKNICIIGATGSIGLQTLDVLRNSKENLKLVAVSANKNYRKLIEIVEEFEPEYVVVTDTEAFSYFKEYCKIERKNLNLLFGMDGLCTISELKEIDIVVTSVVGMVGLKPTIRAIKKGKTIALANKETLVAAGELVLQLAKEYNSKIIPVDSEHSAIFQCLQGNEFNKINKILLTASGGPFRGKNLKDLSDVSVEKALNHPKWRMGKKISIDSATLMNKGLEVIEAHYLFDCNYDNIQVVIHPESIIHSMVEYKDGSIIAELSNPDMRIPIQYALNYPNREKNNVKPLDIFAIGSLNFEKPDYETFTPLKLAFQAGRIGGTAPAILNSANEAAVDLFLSYSISFLQIGYIIAEALNKFEYKSKYDLEDIVNIDSIVKSFIYDKYSKGDI